MFYILLLDDFCRFFPPFTTLEVDKPSDTQQAAFLPPKRKFKEIREASKDTLL